MQRFLNGTPATWDDLARRASRSCVVIDGCRLPQAASLIRRVSDSRSTRAKRSSSWTRASATRATAARCMTGCATANSASPRRLTCAIGCDRNSGPLPRRWAPAAGISGARTACPPATGNRLAQAGPTDRTRRRDRDRGWKRRGTHRNRLLIGELDRRIFGQESVLRTLADRAVQHVRRTSPRHPAILFALGPTGVGMRVVPSPTQNDARFLSITRAEAIAQPNAVVQCIRLACS